MTQITHTYVLNKKLKVSIEVWLLNDCNYISFIYVYYMQLIYKYMQNDPYIYIIVNEPYFHLRQVMTNIP